MLKPFEKSAEITAHNVISEKSAKKRKKTAFAALSTKKIFHSFPFGIPQLSNIHGIKN